MKFGVRLDWLNVTFPSGRCDEVRKFLRFWLGDFVDRGHGQHTYQSSAVSEVGALLAWSEGRSEALLSLNGDALECVPADHHHEFLQMLVRDFGCKATRVDVALDVYDRSAVSMADVHEAAAAYNYRGFVLNERQGAMRGFQRIGDAHTFGRAGKDGSGKYLVVYDKLLEGLHNQKLERSECIDAIRFEARFSKEVAALVGANLSEAGDLREYVVRCGRAVCGVVDFVEREGFEEHIGRALGWPGGRPSSRRSVERCTGCRKWCRLCNRGRFMRISRSCRRCRCCVSCVSRRAWISGRSFMRGWMPGRSG